MTPASNMPPTSARGKVRAGSTVSSATLAAFSNPVIAKNESATPATIAEDRVAVGVELGSVAEVGVALGDVHDPDGQMISSRPATSTKVIAMLSTADWVIPTKLTSTARR